MGTFKDGVSTPNYYGQGKVLLKVASNPNASNTWAEAILFNYLRKINVELGHEYIINVAPLLQKGTVTEIDYSTLTSCMFDRTYFCECLKGSHLRNKPRFEAKCALKHNNCYSAIEGIDPEQAKRERRAELKYGIESAMVEKLMTEIIKEAQDGIGSFVVPTTMEQYVQNANLLFKIQEDFETLGSPMTWSETSQYLEDNGGSKVGRIVLMDTKYLRSVAQLEVAPMFTGYPQLTKIDIEKRIYKFETLTIIGIPNLEKRYGKQAVALDPSKVFFVGVCPSNSNDMQATITIKELATIEKDEDGKDVYITGEVLKGVARFDVLPFDNTALWAFSSASPANQTTTTKTTETK